MDSGDACVLEKGQLEYSVRIIKNDILEEIGELIERYRNFLFGGHG